MPWISATSGAQRPRDVVADLAAAAGLVRSHVERFAAGGPAHGQPGVAWGLVAGGALVASGGTGALRVHPDGGPATAVPDADSVFRIASMTKSFTAAAVVALRDQGRLGLDDPVAGHVPELADVRLPTADSPALTVRHLLTMSGGLPTDDPWGDRQQELAADAFSAFLRGGLSFVWAPGTAFEYCNLGYAILGRVVAAASGLEYADAVRALVLEPLGLASTVFRAEGADPARLAAGYRRTPGVPPLATAGGEVPGLGDRPAWLELPVQPYGAFAPMGGLFSSVRDLARWVVGFADAFPPRDTPEGGHPLSRASRREMQQQHRVAPSRLLAPAVDEPTVARVGGYGFGLVVEHDPQRGAVVHHSGGYPGFGSHMRWHPDSGLGIVVLANSTYAPTAMLAGRLLTAVLDLQQGVGSSAAAATAPSGTAATVRPALRPAAPAPGVPWPATLAAMAAVEALVDRWDDAAARRLLADNVEQDDPLETCAARAGQAAALAGPGGRLARDPAAPPVHDTPAHARWWLRGPLGRVRLEIRLTAHPEPLVQTLAVTPVPFPAEPLAAVVRAVADQTGAACPGWPAGAAIASGCDADRVVRQLRIAAAYAGACRVGELLACDGTRTARVRLVGERAVLELAVEVDGAGAVHLLELGLPEQGTAS